MLYNWIFNIILAIILSFFLIIRLYTYYKSKRNENSQINNNIISVVEIDNNNIDIIKRNLNEISISKQSFEIKGENDIIDKGEAPPLTFNSWIIFCNILLYHMIYSIDFIFFIINYIFKQIIYWLFILLFISN